MKNVKQNVAEINEFMAKSILEMDHDTRAAWDSLSTFEKKLIAFFGWTAKKAYSRIEFERTRTALLQGMYQ